MWKLGASERMTRWKNFRKSLSELSIEDALSETATFWQSCPFSPYYLDPTELSKWPNPWDLIIDNYYCDIAKALGMLYTVYLSTHKDTIVPELKIYYDPKSKVNYNLFVCNQKYVLNLTNEVNDVGDLSKSLIIKHHFTSDDLLLNTY